MYSRSTGYLLLKAQRHNFFIRQLDRHAEGRYPGVIPKGAHYIYTTSQVQYKRLFESAETLINHSEAACDWRLCRIDPTTRCGQDTGGFALTPGCVCTWSISPKRRYQNTRESAVTTVLRPLKLPPASAPQFTRAM
jgi:hypothetical protein